MTTTVSQPSSELGLMLGDGPARPVGLAPDAHLEINPPANFGSATWGGDKVLWALDAKTQPPVLVRGHQIDGDGEVRFNDGDIPPSELVLSPAQDSDPPTGGWFGFASYTRVQHPGCYGYQVDDVTASHIIVFTTTPTS